MFCGAGRRLGGPGGYEVVFDGCADLRFVSGSGVHIRNIRLAPTQGGQFP